MNTTTANNTTRNHYLTSFVLFALVLVTAVVAAGCNDSTVQPVASETTATTTTTLIPTTTTLSAALTTVTLPDYATATDFAQLLKAVTTAQQQYTTTAERLVADTQNLITQVQQYKALPAAAVDTQQLRTFEARQQQLHDRTQQLLAREQQANEEFDAHATRILLEHSLTTTTEYTTRNYKPLLKAVLADDSTGEAAAVQALITQHGTDNSTEKGLFTQWLQLQMIIAYYTSVTPVELTASRTANLNYTTATAQLQTAAEHLTQQLRTAATNPERQAEQAAEQAAIEARIQQLETWRSSTDERFGVVTTALNDLPATATQTQKQRLNLLQQAILKHQAQLDTQLATERSKLPQTEQQPDNTGGN